MIGRIEHGRKLRSLSRKQRAEPLLLTDVSASAASIDAPSPLAGEGCSEVQYEQPGEGSALAASSDSSPNCGCRSVCAALSRKGRGRNLARGGCLASVTARQILYRNKSVSRSANHFAFRALSPADSATDFDSNRGSENRGTFFEPARVIAATSCANPDGLPFFAAQDDLSWDKCVQ